MNARVQTLRALLEFSKSIEQLRQQLSAFPLDCDQELVSLRPIHLVAVPMRYGSGEFTEKEVQDWAELIECRDGIGFEGGTWRTNPRMLTRTRQSTVDSSAH
jgi:hypothetical protein